MARHIRRRIATGLRQLAHDVAVHIGFARPTYLSRDEVPADVPLAFSIIDAEGRSIQTHTNWIQVRPGERRTCDGCHSPRRGGALNSGAIVNAIREKTQGPFNINLFVQETPHPTEPELQKAFALLNPIRTKLGLAPATPLAAYCEDFRAQLEVLIELKLPVVSFTFGLLDAESVERLHRAGSVVIGTATNLAEAHAWKDNGADIICAQGAEAGGHRGTFIGSYDDSMIGTMALVPQIVDGVGLPVIAAGGIMDGRGIAAALALGAHAC